MEHASNQLNEEETIDYVKKFPSLLKYKKKFIIFKREKDYKFMDQTDKFAFYERMKCRRDKLSPMEYARKYKMTLKNIRKSRKVAECSLFPTPMALAVLQMFKPKKWLDPTAGWGDRLRAALLANIDQYVGIDSNKSLEKVYKQIQDYYGKDSKTETQIFISKFQDANIDKFGKFDLVFTSPPFSMLEIYEHMNIVSDKEFQTDFMNKLFELSINKLKINGHLVLYIENVNIDYLTVQTSSLFPKLKFEGAFYYEGLTKPRPYYVWKKV
jgi:16S rRNA G966 N2-methylase RsmD